MASNLREYHKRLRRKLKNLKIDKSAVKYTDDVLGRGSYAVVVALEVNSLECAGKKLHDTLFDWSSNEEKVYLVDKFAEECIRMGQLRHPNIVQLLGVDYDETSITLVMERLPMSLSECLERYEDIPYFIKNAILLDVALGLNYLHKQVPPIIHRDLSTNNVLLTSTLQAKIADLGVARALQPRDDASDSFEPMTMVPGNQIVMPPEALINAIDESGKGLAVYDTKLDCFSFGNVIVQVVCQTDQLKLPDHESDPAYPSEARRRSRYLQTMKDHPLYKLTVQCLENDPKERPSADDIVRCLRAIILNDPPPFENQIVMFKAFLSNNKAVHSLQMEALQKSWAQECSDSRCQNLELEVAGLKAKLETLEHELEIKNADVTTSNAKIAAKELVIQNLNTQLAWNETDSPSNDQPVQQEVVEARKKTSPISLQSSALADMPREAAPCARPRPRGSKDSGNLSLSFPSQQSTSVCTTPVDKSCHQDSGHHTTELPSPVPKPRRPRVSRLSSDTSMSTASSSISDGVCETPESPSTNPRPYPNELADVMSTQRPQMYEHRLPPMVPVKRRPRPVVHQRPTSTSFQELSTPSVLPKLPKPQTLDSHRIKKNASLGLTNLAKYAGDPELKRRLAEQHAKTVTNIPSASIQKLEQKKSSAEGLDDGISSIDPKFAK